MQDWEAARAREVARLDRHIAEYGWSVMYIGGAPSLAYTVGLMAKRLPEVVVFGLDRETAGWMLNETAELAVRGGPFTPGAELVVNAGHTRLRVDDLPGADEVLLAAATYYHDRRPVSALQLTWEVDGAFPGDPGYPYDEGVQPRPGTYRIADAPE